jgi:hypothetical protein
MIKGLIEISSDRNGFAMRIFHFIKLQCAKDNDSNTVIIRFGLWRFYTSISFTYTNNQKAFHTHGVS